MADPTHQLGGARRLRLAFTAARRAVGDGPVQGSRRERGVAMMLALTAIAILAVFSLEFTYQSRVAVRTSTYVEAEIEAYLHARAAVELSALVIGSTDIIDTLISRYAGMLGGRKPNISTAAYGCEFVNAFCKGQMSLMGMNLVDMTGNPGVGLERGGCGCKSTDEDGRINLNRVRSLPEKQTVFDTLYKLLERHEGRIAQAGAIDRELAQIALNVIDWADPDTVKTDIDPSTRKVRVGGGAEGVGYSKLGYKSKDAPFDSTAEVRLVDGMTDRLWCAMRDELTVYNTGKINVNTAPLPVIKALVCKNLADPTRALDPQVCGAGIGGVPSAVDVAGQYVQICRQLKELIFSPPFSAPARFVQFFDKLGGVLQAQFGPMGKAVGDAIRVNHGLMLGDVGTTGRIVRIEAWGTSGRVKKRITALLDTTTQRYVGWKED